MREALPVARLTALLNDSGHPAASPILAIAAARMDDPIPLARQEPHAWSQAIKLKYSMVRERGYRVQGLESLVDALAASADAHVVGGAMIRGDESCVVVLDEQCQHLVGLLYIAPGPITS